MASLTEVDIAGLELVSEADLDAQAVQETLPVPETPQVLQARGALTQAEATLARAREELEQAQASEADARAQYQTHEAARLRGEHVGAGVADLRHQLAERRIQTETLADLCTVLESDVLMAQHAVGTAEHQAQRQAAAQQWNGYVDEQAKAVARVLKAIRELNAAGTKMLEVAQQQQALAPVLGFEADAYVFHRRIFRHYLGMHLMGLLPDLRPVPELRRFLGEAKLDDPALNPFVVRVAEEEELHQDNHHAHQQRR